MAQSAEAMRSLYARQQGASDSSGPESEDDMVFSGGDDMGFMNEEERRKQRISCLECSRSKTLCDKEYPCSRCKKRGTQCVERFRLARRTAQEMKLLRKKKSKKKLLVHKKTKSRKSPLMPGMMGRPPPMLMHGAPNAQAYAPFPIGGLPPHLAMQHAAAGPGGANPKMTLKHFLQHTADGSGRYGTSAYPGGGWADYGPPHMAQQPYGAGPPSSWGTGPPPISSYPGHHHYPGMPPGATPSSLAAATGSPPFPHHHPQAHMGPHPGQLSPLKQGGVDAQVGGCRRRREEGDDEEVEDDDDDDEEDEGDDEDEDVEEEEDEEEEEEGKAGGKAAGVEEDEEGAMLMMATVAAAAAAARKRDDQAKKKKLAHKKRRAMDGMMEVATAEGMERGGCCGGHGSKTEEEDRPHMAGHGEAEEATRGSREDGMAVDGEPNGAAEQVVCGRKEGPRQELAAPMEDKECDGLAAADHMIRQLESLKHILDEEKRQRRAAEQKLEGAKANEAQLVSAVEELRQQKLALEDEVRVLEAERLELASEAATAKHKADQAGEEAKAAKDEVVKLQKHVRSLLWTASNSNGTTSDDANDSSSSSALLNGQEAAEAPPSALDRDQVLVMAEQVITQI